MQKSRNTAKNVGARQRMRFALVSRVCKAIVSPFLFRRTFQCERESLRKRLYVVTSVMKSATNSPCPGGISIQGFFCSLLSLWLLPSIAAFSGLPSCKSGLCTKRLHKGKDPLHEDRSSTASPPSSLHLGSPSASASDGGGNDPVDRAPCFDGVCASEPVAHDSAHEGEATTRLGGPMTGPTVWSEFGRLAQEQSRQHGAMANLGQGFPDWLPPKFAVDSLVEAATDSAQSPHQYTRTAGHPNLVKELAGRYSVHMGRKIDPMAQVAVTVGASQALYMSLQTLIKPGDEVILFEPFFDLYVNQIKLAGGTPVYVPLTFVPYDSNEENGSDAVTGGEWVLDPSELQKAISPHGKTRAIILNSPHNPTGKVFTRSEMERIAEAVTSAGPQCVVLSDEVYKYIVHSPPKDEVNGAAKIPGGTLSSPPSSSAVSCPGHIHFASLPGMWDRTITVSSAGKTFSATGWQVGWCVGPERLISPIHQLLPYVQFCASTVIQEALARTLPKADRPYNGHSSYYEYLKDKYGRKRDLLADALKVAGFAVPDYDVTPGGGFFIFARIGKEVAAALPADRVNVPNSAAPGGIARRDWALCQWMAEEKGVLCIPSSPFFSRERAMSGASDEFIRIAFCKEDETIEAAAEALLRVRGESPSVVNANVNGLRKTAAEKQSILEI